MAWFDFRQGNIVVKNPDGAILGKMWQLAERLKAKPLAVNALLNAIDRIGDCDVERITDDR